MMPLILAIESNKTQAQQIALLVKQHLKGAELVAASSAPAGLEALGDRVPDLILTPALLAHRDEQALTDRLRKLGPSAAHVHTLAVPILAASKTRAQETGGGILGKRRDRSEPESVGCDPSMFAAEIKVYLERAARERVAPAAPAQSQAPPPAPAAAAAPDDLDEIVWLSTEPPADAPPPKKPRVESPSTRAFEAEFGLPASSPGSAPLWRVTEEGIDALAPEPEPGPVAPVAAVAPARVEPVVVEDPEPVAQEDEWAYFDPAQSRFKALIRRLDDIARLS